MREGTNSGGGRKSSGYSRAGRSFQSLMHTDIDISAETDRWICSVPSGALFYLRAVIAEYSRVGGGGWDWGGRRGTFNRDIPIRISLLLFDRQENDLSVIMIIISAGRTASHDTHFFKFVRFQLACPSPLFVSRTTKLFGS